MDNLSNFDSPDHALQAGMFLGVLARHGINAEPVMDDEGNYTSKVKIHEAPGFFMNSVTITITIDPPVSETGQKGAPDA